LCIVAFAPFAKSQPHPVICFLTQRLHLLLKLGLDDVLERDSVGGELADTLAELLDGHLVLVEVKAEAGLVVDVALLLDVKSAGAGSIELLGDRVAGVEEVLEKVGLFGNNRVSVMDSQQVQLRQ